MSSLERRLAADDSHSDFSVPNLVPLVGEQKAADFFRRNVFYQFTSWRVNISEGEETKKLARTLALQMVARN